MPHPAGCVPETFRNKRLASVSPGTIAWRFGGGAPSPPSSPAAERGIWYQYYFNTERGRAGLQMNRQALCRFLWETWSPTWKFTDETFNRTAASFDNPDFVDVVIHSYRHRIGNAAGEPRFRARHRGIRAAVRGA